MRGKLLYRRRVRREDVVQVEPVDARGDAVDVLAELVQVGLAVLAIHEPQVQAAHDVVIEVRAVFFYLDDVGAHQQRVELAHGRFSPSGCVPLQ